MRYIPTLLPFLYLTCFLVSQDDCISSQNFLGRVILKRPGSTCNLHRGYCDAYGLCVTVDSDDELNKLKDAFKRFFSKAAMSDLWNWITEQWLVLRLDSFLDYSATKFCKTSWRCACYTKL